MRYASSPRNDDGFSIVELLLATLLTLIVVGAAIGLMNHHTLASRVQPETVDAQQRLRAGVDMLFRDVYMAGAGLDTGTMAGPLIAYLPPVLPRRIGLRNADAPEVARQDAITLIHVPAASAQTSLSAPIAALTVDLQELAGCPIGRAPCGLGAGAGLLIFDDRGHFDLFTVLAVQGSQGTLRHRGQSGPYSFLAGAHAAEVETRTYYFDAASRQLRSYNGDATDAPVIDDVSGLTVEYFGSADPPRSPKPPAGIANCLYDAAGVPEPGLATLAAVADGLAVLAPAMLGDGPWCGAGDTRFDADLLRIRRVRITLAVSTAGSARGHRDYAATVDVAPRNLAGQS